MHDLQMDRELTRIPGLFLQWDADMTSHTTIGTQSRAALLVEAQTPLSLKKLTMLCARKGYPMMMLAGGSNTVFARSFFDGIVVKLAGQAFRQKDVIAPNIIRVGAATVLSDLINFSRKSGMMGLEFCTMIPGQVGGALAGNAGAGRYGLCDYVDSVLVLTRDGELFDVQRNGFSYGYRKSDLREAIILEANIRLMPYNKQLSLQNGRDFREKKKNQPYKLPNAGCIFKNPKHPVTGESISAGKLIDEAGLKNYELNGCAVSDGHANFIVNKKNASGEDFMALMRLIQDIVFERTGIELEPEARIVGSSGEALTNCVLW
ncbi:MAG: UDP-N-acetylmuramate dehydrogenase [Sumerlaeia bacterium]